MIETEKINKKTIGISNMSIKDIVNIIINESYNSLNALMNAKNDISSVIPIIIERIKNGGRVIYTGAGTSGRIAAQDVIELFPTYGMDNKFFDYVMCGGKKALYKSVEGSEDNIKQAVIDLKRKKLNKNDVLIGITASGETPYVLSAIKYAKSLNAYTVGITNNTKTGIEKISNYTIVLKTGAEVIQGSTRMNAGTSQKIILNTISTTVAILMKRTNDNVMDHMKSYFNEKLRERALNILIDNFNINKISAENLLKNNDYDIKKAIDSLNKKYN